METTEKQKANKERLDLDEILFDVEMVKADFDCNSDYSYDIFAYPESFDGTCSGRKLRVNSCSNRYELIPNSEIFLPIRQTLLDAGINFSETYYHINNARFYCDITIEDHAFEVVKGDFVKPMLRIQHSYNGLADYTITFGYFRLVCTNGLIVPVKEMSKFNVSIKGKHTKSIKRSFDQLKNAVDLFVSQKVSDDPIQTFKVMANNWLDNWEERATDICTKSGIAIKKDNKNDTLGYFLNTINNDKKELGVTDGKVNDWLLYNAINHYIHNDDQNIKAPSVRLGIEKKVLNAMLV